MRRALRSPVAASGRMLAVLILALATSRPVRGNALHDSALRSFSTNLGTCQHSHSSTGPVPEADDNLRPATPRLQLLPLTSLQHPAAGERVGTGVHATYERVTAAAIFGAKSHAFDS